MPNFVFVFLYLPTINNSHWGAFERKRCQISIVNIVDEELNIDVSDDINAAIIQASIRPRKPFGINRITINGYAISVQDILFPHISVHESGVEQPIKSYRKKKKNKNLV